MSGDSNDRLGAGGQRTANSPSLGQVLKTARGSRALTLEQISAELRIETRQLLALEQDQFEHAGAPVFVKGYLRQYGQRLGLDYRDLLLLYYQQVDQAEVVIQPSRSIKLRDERQITVWMIAGLVLAVLIVSLVVWWLNEFGAPSSAADVVSTAPVVRTDRAEDREIAAPAAPVDSRDLAVAAPAAAEDPSETLLQLDLLFDQESWAEITDASGERLFYGLGRAGRSASLVGEPPILVLLGNADGVQLAVDGDDYSIPRAARQGNLARLTLTAPQD